MRRFINEYEYYSFDLCSFRNSFMGGFYSSCCPIYETAEKDFILSVTSSGTSMSNGSEMSVVYEQQDSRSEESESDPELHAFIMRRNQVDKDTEEWEKLNYDIHTLRCARRKVCTRWKKILLQLGYQKEVESLLTVNRRTVLSNWENVEKSRDLLHIVLEETGLFPHGLSTNKRYLFVMDRLVSLDSAEDFVRLAKEKYPRINA